MSFELFATTLVAQTFARYEISVPSDVSTTNLCIKEHVVIDDTTTVVGAGSKNLDKKDENASSNSNAGS